MFIRIPLIVACCAALAGCATTPGLSSANLETTASCLPTDPVFPAAPTSVVPLATRVPLEPDSIEKRARQADATGRRDVAEAYYLQWTHLQPKQANPWFQLGNLYAEQGRLDAAEWAYREALRRHDDARTLHNLGLVQVRLGVGALREVRERLPADDPVRQQTREFLQTLLEAVAQ